MGMCSVLLALVLQLIVLQNVTTTVLRWDIMHVYYWCGSGSVSWTNEKQGKVKLIMVKIE